MMTPERESAERYVLSRKLPENAYRFMDLNSANPYLVMAAITNRGNLYTLRIELNDFPNKIPAMYVTKRLLLKSGQPIPENDINMNTLKCDDKMTGIRYQEHWDPNISLYMVYYRGKIWLDNYEHYLHC